VNRPFQRSYWPSHGRTHGRNLFCLNRLRVGNDREDLGRDGDCENMFIIQTKFGLEERQDLPDKSLIMLHNIVIHRGGGFG